MELSSSVRLSEGGEQARNLLDKLTDLIEANSIFKPRLLRKNSFNLFIEHEITAPAGLKLESSVQRIAGRYSYGEVLTGAAACVEGVRNWQAVQVSNNALFEELIRLVGKNVPEGFDRLASAPPILAEKARGWCYQEWCGDCDGHGAHSCGRCDGEGTLRCEYCNGVGDVDCCRCRGRGYHLDEQQQRVFCRSCYQGKVSCWHCSLAAAKRGHVLCVQCGGRGSVNCDSCAASGIQTLVYSALITVDMGGVKSKCCGKLGENEERLIGELLINPKRLFKCSLASGSARLPVANTIIDQNKRKFCQFIQKVPITIYIAEVQTDGGGGAVKVFQRAGETLTPWKDGSLDGILSDAVNLTREADPISALRAARKTRVGSYLLMESFGGTSRSIDFEIPKGEVEVFSASVLQTWRKQLVVNYERIPRSVVNSLWGWMVFPLSAAMALYGYIGGLGDAITSELGPSKSLVILVDLTLMAFAIGAIWKLVGFTALSRIREEIPDVQKLPTQGIWARCAIILIFMSAITGSVTRYGVHTEIVRLFN